MERVLMLLNLVVRIMDTVIYLGAQFIDEFGGWMKKA
jgi:hypothetical protein